MAHSTSTWKVFSCLALLAASSLTVQARGTEEEGGHAGLLLRVAQAAVPQARSSVPPAAPSLRAVEAASEPMRQWLKGTRDAAAFAEAYRVFSAGVTSLEAPAAAVESAEARAAGLYLRALEALSDYVWLQDVDARRRKMRRARELLGKDFKGTLDEIDLVPYRNLSVSSAGDATADRVGTLIARYRLRTEERKFDSRDVKGVYAFVAEGWAPSLLAAASAMLDEAVAVTGAPR